METSENDHRSYQMDCPQCRSVAALRDKAAPLQAHINRDLGRSYSPYKSPNGLTLRQQGAMAWSKAIAACLLREMALHARCGACSVLMGPGHIEEGIGEFCATHAKSVGSRSRRPRNWGEDSLEWIAAQAAH